MIAAITAYKRPEYLRAVLDSLDVAAQAILPEPTFLVARVEPSPVQNIMLDMIGSSRGTYATGNDTLLGCCWNTLAVLDDAWRVADRFEEDFVLMLEEDYVLAPDALAMHVWMREAFRGQPSTLCTGSFCRESPTYDTDFNRIIAEPNFVPQVWGTWRDRWEEIRPLWHDRKPEDRGPVSTPGKGYYLGWDVNFDTYIMQGRTQIRPALSRVVHIGLEDGQHTTPSIYPKTLPRSFAGFAGIELVEDIPVESGLWA